MKTAKIARENLKDFIKATNGRFFSADFFKKDGSKRHINARLGVKKHLKGGVNKVEAPDRPYMTVWDAQKKGYRTLNLHTVDRLYMGGTVYEVVD